MSSSGTAGVGGIPSTGASFGDRHQIVDINLLVPRARSFGSRRKPCRSMFASLLSCWYPLQLLVLIGSGQRRCAGYQIDGIPWEQGFGLRTRSALRPAERGRSPPNGAFANKSGTEAVSGRGALPAVVLEKVYLCEELGNSQHSQSTFNQSPICGSARRMWVLLRTPVAASGGMGGIHPTSCTALVLGCSWSA